MRTTTINRNRAPVIERLEARRLLSAAPGGDLDVQKTFAGPLALQQPLVVRVNAKRHMTLHRVALTMVVSSESSNGQLGGTLTVAHVGNFSFAGTISRSTFQISFGDSAGDSGTIAGTASAAGRHINGRFDGTINGLRIDGSINATAKGSSAAPTTARGAAIALPPNFSTGLLSAAPVGAGVIQPGNGFITPVTGMSVPSNGFTQPFVGISTPTAVGSITGAITPSTGGFVGSGALGGTFVTGGIFGQTMISF